MFFEVKNFQALRRAMKRLSEYLEESDIPEENVFDSKLVVSELVGNVLRHSDGVASLEVHRAESAFVRLFLPARRKPLSGRIVGKRARAVYCG